MENLQQNQYVEDPATAAGLMVSSFRPQESSSTKVKVERLVEKTFIRINLNINTNEKQPRRSLISRPTREVSS